MNVALLLVCLVPATSLTLIGCGDTEPSSQSVTSPLAEARERDYEVVEFDDGGSIAGHVRWEGPRPPLDALPVRTNRAECGETQESAALRLSERGGVADVVITLLGIQRGHDQLEGADVHVLRREGCRFVPHVSVVQVGTRLRLSNHDEILHNALALDEAGETVFDVGLPRLGSSADRTLTHPGLLRVLCDAGHTFEQAFVHVVPHPYAAVTGPDGSFRLLNVPPGQYVLHAWHEGWRVVGTERGRPEYSNPVILTRTVSVSSRQETPVDFSLSQQSAEIAGDR